MDEGFLNYFFYNLFIFLTFYIFIVTLSLFATERFDATQSEQG